jgi:23S rRNA pseudouridine1911/1915/1917 synthase
MQYRNRPILGDPLYGARRGRANFGLDRQFLHAFQLGFQHPRSDTWRTFEAPLPADLQHVLERLRRSV